MSLAKFKFSHEFTSRVRDVSSLGLGVVDHPEAGMVFFVAGVWPGDLARFRVTGIFKRYGFADLLEVVEQSPSRVKPVCEYQGHANNRCGACSWMMVDYEAQLEQKQKTVATALQRASILPEGREDILKTIWGSPKNLGFRNRAQVKTDGKILGFVATGTRNLIDVKKCAILSEKNQQTMQALRNKLPNPAWEPTPPHNWNFIDIDDEMASVDEGVVLNKRLAFKQANDAQNLRMREWLAARLATWGNNPNSEVVELFCGSGNFTEIISAAGFKKIVAVEVAGNALATLEAKSFSNVETVAADLYQPGDLSRFKKTFGAPEMLILDPPRSGLANMRDFLKTFPTVNRIVYIACDLSSYVRDAHKLVEDGWRAVEIQPLDQFPHTPHIEILSEFVK